MDEIQNTPEGRLTTAELRREILALLSRSTPFTDELPDEDNELPEGGVVTAALVVIEWQSSSGDRWLSRLGMLGSAQGAPRWTIEMLAREALNWEN